MTNLQQEVEEWKDIPGFEGFYKISNLGKVLSLERIIKQPEGFGLQRINKERLLKIKTNARGYSFVVLHAAPKKKIAYIHRYVMLVFEGEPPVDKPLVMHKDDNPKNNAFSNLKYGSSLDNVLDASNKGRLVHTKLVCSRSMLVFKFSDECNFLEEYKSLTHAANENGVFQSNIKQAIVNGWPCAGFMWSFDRYKVYKSETHRISVEVFDGNMSLIKRYSSISEAVVKFGITRTTILRSHNENRKTKFGHYWKIAS